MRALRISLIVLAIATNVGGCNTLIGAPPGADAPAEDWNSVFWREHRYYAEHSGYHKPGY